MTIDEFVKEIKQLENFFGKELTDEQKQIWFKELHYLELPRFRYIETQIYKTLKFMPKLADIIEINSSLGYSQAKKDKENINCAKCRGTGYITYLKTIDNGTGGKLKNEYGAICSCRQKARYEGWKITDERYRTNYYTPYAEEIGM